MVLTAQISEARENLTALVGCLPPDVHRLLPEPPECDSKPRWAFDRIQLTRERLLLLPHGERDEVRASIGDILEQAQRIEEARHKLVLGNLRLVVNVANTYRKQGLPLST